ncbi:MAG: tRNA pseudouridine(55) synthase TruB [Candidatus Margulisiibacteriota bacterium]|jgi:tRNA pseudouridine55 synthase
MEINEIAGILLVRKPIGISSFRVVHEVRKFTKQKRVGHAGTLDPFASGLLIIAIGRQYTKKIVQFQNLSKTYLVDLVFGIQTDSFDSFGNVEITTNRSSIISFEREALDGVLSKFLGEQLQYPPIFSAKKVNGKRLYEYARKGQSVEIRPNLVTFHEIELIDYKSGFLPHFRIKLKVSKGTYIRSFVHDLGIKFGVGAYAKDLVRTHIGEYSLESALDFKDLNCELIKENLLT